MKKYLFFIMLSLPNMAPAFTECLVTPNKAWLNFNGTSIWVCFEEGGCINKVVDSTFTNDIMDRLYSTALTAITRNSSIRVRYPEDNANCSQVTTLTRNDTQGIWFLK
ncbi:MAG: hypothetical protein Tsb002_24110 [Wenzhouxiangellaceae bacterium]